ncbi:MAG: TrmJ/YjtD family RNA methyltransferase [Acidobacteria bacterium]|nr:TrmJ/YjtD family RNA methyltransferase [Acidobacteriota bacterium]
MNCRVVLVRPRDPNNIGAAARAMKNFGFRDLAIVSPHPPVWEEVVSAINAMDLVRSARVFDSLAEAVADRTLVIGTTDPRRLESSHSYLTPRDLSRQLAQSSQPTAIVFGPEKHGLTNDDLSYCHRIMTIPTLPDCPSMNLGQAVAVCCYELAISDREPEQGAAPVDSANSGNVEKALDLALDLLRRSDYIIPDAEPHLAIQLRTSLLRFSMTENEVNRLIGALRKIGSALENK